MFTIIAAAIAAVAAIVSAIITAWTRLRHEELKRLSGAVESHRKECKAERERLRADLQEFDKARLQTESEFFRELKNLNESHVPRGEHAIYVDLLREVRQAQKDRVN